jgi:hypothetical protein
MMASRHLDTYVVMNSEDQMYTYQEKHIGHLGIGPTYDFWESSIVACLTDTLATWHEAIHKKLPHAGCVLRAANK